MVEVAVDKAPGSQNMYTRVMEAAEQREDHQMMAHFVVLPMVILLLLKLGIIERRVAIHVTLVRNTWLHNKR